MMLPMKGSPEIADAGDTVHRSGSDCLHVVVKMHLIIIIIHKYYNNYNAHC